VVLLLEGTLRDKEKDFQAQQNTRLKTYNKVLEMEGKTSLVSCLAGSYVEFDINAYKEKIRPILYQDFHVLHQDVAEIVGSIDRDIQQMELA
jgi:hypothetical protein